MKRLHDEFNHKINNVLDTTNFQDIYDNIEIHSKYSPETLYDLVLISIYRMENRRRNEEVTKLQFILSMLKNDDNVNKYSLLYIVSYLDKINNHNSIIELNLYN